MKEKPADNEDDFISSIYKKKQKRQKIVPHDELEQ